jgi:hypothetical protein
MRVRPGIAEAERVLPGLVWPSRRDSLLTSSPGFRERRVSSLLTAKTTVKSASEEACKWSLLEHGVVAYYEVHTFPISDGVHAYLPDFTIELTVNGRQVILEPHGFPSGIYASRSAQRAISERNRAYTSKIGMFHKEYGSDLYLILISDHHGRSLAKIADEYWQIPIMSAHPAASYRAGKRRLDAQLDGLIRRSDQSALFGYGENARLKELARAS